MRDILPRLECERLSEISASQWQNVRAEYYFPESSSAEGKMAVLSEFSDIMCALDITAFITGGTLLGIHRDNAFIEWDDDVDCDVLSEEISDKIPDVIREMKNHNFIVRFTGGSWPKFSFFKYGEKLSLGILFPDKNKKWLLRPEYKYPGHLFDRPSKLTFRGLTLNAPSPPGEYLEHVYGSMWTVPVKSDIEQEYMSIGVKRLSLKQYFVWTIKATLNWMRRS